MSAVFFFLFCDKTRNCRPVTVIIIFLNTITSKLLCCTFSQTLKWFIDENWSELSPQMVFYYGFTADRCRRRCVDCEKGTTRKKWANGIKFNIKWMQNVLLFVGIIKNAHHQCHVLIELMQWNSPFNHVDQRISVRSTMAISEIVFISPTLN